MRATFLPAQVFEVLHWARATETRLQGLTGVSFGRISIPDQEAAVSRAKSDRGGVKQLRDEPLFMP
jgi:hypothetical protein